MDKNYTLEELTMMENKLQAMENTLDKMINDTHVSLDSQIDYEGMHAICGGMHALGIMRSKVKYAINAWYVPHPEAAFRKNYKAPEMTPEKIDALAVIKNMLDRMN